MDTVMAVYKHTTPFIKIYTWHLYNLKSTLGTIIHFIKCTLFIYGIVIKV